VLQITLLIASIKCGWYINQLQSNSASLPVFDEVSFVKS